MPWTTKSRAIAIFVAMLACAQASGQGLGPDASGRLPRVNQPPWPASIPGYTEVDPETGLHMTGTPQPVDLATYRLKVTGNVDHPLSLGLDDLRRMPCMLAAVLNLAGLRSSAYGIDLVSADGYATHLILAQALAPAAFLAYELEGKVIPVLHGFPLRAVLPGLTDPATKHWLGPMNLTRSDGPESWESTRC